MSLDAEEYQSLLCGKTAQELLFESTQCTAARLKYVQKMCRRTLTPLEEAELAHIDELQDLINDAKDALTCMRNELPFCIAPPPKVKRRTYNQGDWK
jgi:hypothetical protein